MPKFNIGDYVIVQNKGMVNHPCFQMLDGYIAIVEDYIESDDNVRRYVGYDDEPCYLLKWHDSDGPLYFMPCGQRIYLYPQAPERWLQPFDIEAYNQQKVINFANGMRETLHG